MSKTSRGQTEADKRLFFVSLGVFAISLVVVFLVINDGRGSGESIPPLAPAGSAVPPTVAVLLTSIPAQVESAGGLGEGLDALETMVDSCADYGDDRRAQMALHFQWLRNPDLIPRDLLVAMGDETVERLVLGMSTFTLQEWNAQERPPDSCLVPIGRRLNDIMVSIGMPAAEQFN
jgi:hypothetical protein